MMELDKRGEWLSPVDSGWLFPSREDWTVEERGERFSDGVWAATMVCMYIDFSSEITFRGGII